MRLFLRFRKERRSRTTLGKGLRLGPSLSEGQEVGTGPLRLARSATAVCWGREPGPAAVLGGPVLERFAPSEGENGAHLSSYALRQVQSYSQQ